MRTIIRDFTYFDRTFDKGDRVPDNDPLVALFPDLFEPAKPKAAKPATSTKKERP